MRQSDSFLLLPKPPVSLLLKLGIDDLMHDRKVSFFIMASIVAVVAPLLLLFGLKFGIVSQMRAELLADPRNLEIRMLGSAKLDDAWFAQFKKTRIRFCSTHDTLAQYDRRSLCGWAALY